MAESSGDKKHAATETRRRKAREQGQVAKSQDLTSALMLLVALITLIVLGRSTIDQLAHLLQQTIGDIGVRPFTSSDAVSDLTRQSLAWGWIVVPILAIMLLASVAIQVFQSGLLFLPEKLTPKLSYINPLSGLKRVFSLQGTMKLLFGIGKIILISFVAYLAVRRQQDVVLGISQMEVPLLARTLFDCVIEATLYVAAALVAIAILEYGFQAYKHEQDLRMTDQEVRDEMKEAEGNPLILQRRRQLQRQMALQRAESEVPKADFVVSNPTELAIAIQYDPSVMIAPVVLAKGAGLLAQRIRRIALEHGVPIVERKPLAQVLYKTVEVGDTIPPEQYQAVAEVLRYVYQLKGKELPQAAAA